MPTKASVSKSAVKTAAKTAVSPLSGGVIPLGAHPGNTGGKKGRSGPRPAIFKDFLAKLRANPAALAALERAACDETLKSFGPAWKLVTDYDTEKPADKKELSGKVEVTVRIAREGRRVTAS